MKRIISHEARSFVSCVVVWVITMCCFALGQYYPNQEIRIGDLPPTTARSRELSDVLVASVEIIFHDKEVCCGKESALGDRVRSADARSLKNIGGKLRGTYALSDGRSLIVTAEYLEPEAINVGKLIDVITQQRAPLIAWNSHLYVICGLIFDRTIDYSTGGKMDAVRKFLLIDPRFSDERRQLSFDRRTVDWRTVQGLLILDAHRQ